MTISLACFHCGEPACEFVCPTGAIQKRHLCADRLELGKEPPCVVTCSAEALHFGTMEELAYPATGRLARKLFSATSHATINGRAP